MSLKDVLWDIKAGLATIAEGESVGWKDEALYRVPLVDGQPRIDLRSKRRGYIERVLYRESLEKGGTGLHDIKFISLQVNRRTLTK